MGTGVGEAALAAEAIGAAEAATAGAGFLEGMAGVSALEGAGVAGLGLETGAGLSGLMGAGYGGASTLAPGLQSAISGTATVMPEVAAQTMAAANQGAVPAAFMDVGGTGVSSGLPFPTGGMGVQPPLPSLSPATAADVTQMMDVGFNPATATTEMGGNLARQTMNYVDPVEMLKAPTAVEKAGFTNPLTSAYNWYKEQDKPTRYGLAGLGALQAAKYLNKQQGGAPAEKYSGPLSKFTYSPDTYRPYTYKPYVAGGPVEEMSRENAIGANTGYPQSDIQQGAYATPWQTPVSRNVVAGAGDVGVDQMTGMERMAEGGTAEAAPAMPAVAASQQNFSDFLSRYQGAPEQAGLTPFNPIEQSMPAVMASRQNFADFLARYQNMPVTEAAPPPVVYQGLYAGKGPKLVNTEPEWGGYSGASGGRVSPAGFGGGGIANLGGYSDGGRLLKGPGDGMSDNIPATIGRKQPARLADGEFVVPADVVSGLGNGSTDAGAKQLYKMLDKVRSARTGKKKQGKQINPNKYMPA